MNVGVQILGGILLGGFMGFVVAYLLLILEELRRNNDRTNR